jgi:DNA methylase
LPKRKANALPAGGGGGWAKMNESMAANRAKRASGNLTFVKGNRHAEDLDDTSRRILEPTITGTSIFDPVLCELAYRWFCPPGGLVLDPFAGGSVRGIVASKCGRRYIGIDLSERQCAANEAQAEAICGDGEMPLWACGDAADIGSKLEMDPADFVFSCPPYGDLEVYSDNPADLSTMTHDEFMAAYRTIIAVSIGKLKDDRFACFVVGDYRDKQGFYWNFPGETVAAFEMAGAGLYNEMTLVTAAGSLPIRAGKQFAATRKVGKTHQNMLVFCKGDPRKATEACGSVEIDEALFAEEEFGELL